MRAILSCHWGRFVCTCRPVYLQTSYFDFVLLCSSLGSTAVVVEYSYPMQKLINQIHCKSDRHQTWPKHQQTTKTLSAFFVKEQNPVGSSSSSSSITNTSNNYNTNSSSSNANGSSGGSNNVYQRGGGVWVGGLVLGGCLKTPKPPSPFSTFPGTVPSFLCQQLHKPTFWVFFHKLVGFLDRKTF